VRYLLGKPRNRAKTGISGIIPYKIIRLHPLWKTLSHCKNPVSASRFAARKTSRGLTGDPVIQSTVVRSVRPRRTGYSALAEYDGLRRRLLARLVDRDVLTMRHRGAAVGDHKGVELDEAVALLFIIAGHLGARGQFVAAGSCRQ